MSAPMLWIGEGQAPDAAVAGGKGHGLGLLCEAGLRVPEAFVVPTQCYRAAVTTELQAQIDAAIAALHPESDLAALDTATGRLRALVFQGTAGHQCEANIRTAYHRLCEVTGTTDLPVAVRSSSAAEDASDRSFAGEHDTYLWVVGEDDVCEQVRRCWASLYTSRAISYRAQTGDAATTSDDAMAVVVQRMVDARSAGVFMTLNPTNGDRSKVVIESVWGLGEPLVSGTATPDRYTVDKVTREVIARVIVDKPTRAVRDPLSGRGLAEVEVAGQERQAPSLTNDEISELARIARVVEKFAGCPQDGEFAIAGDGGSEQVFLVQARPETVWSTKTRPPVSTGGDALSRIISTLTRTSPGV